MPQNVTDLRSNLPDQIANAANVIGRSGLRQAVFEAVCKGKKREKTIAELAEATGLSQKQVLEGGRPLALAQLVEKVKGGYRKDQFLSNRYRQILNYAKNPKKLSKLATKTRPLAATPNIQIKFPIRAAKAVHITVDDIDSFRNVRAIKTPSSPSAVTPLPEADIKRAFQAILGESGTFKDWGGEKNDLFTTKISVGRRRRAAVVAFKGKATRGVLTLEKMGKRADQVLRLFHDPVPDVYLVVYQGQISSSVIEMMKALSVAKAIAGHNVFFGVLDRDDLERLRLAYPAEFALA